MATIKYLNLLAAILDFGRHFENFPIFFHSGTNQKSILHLQNYINARNENLILKTTTPF